MSQQGQLVTSLRKLVFCNVNNYSHICKTSNQQSIASYARKLLPRDNANHSFLLWQLIVVSHFLRSQFTSLKCLTSADFWRSLLMEASRRSLIRWLRDLPVWSTWKAPQSPWTTLYTLVFCIKGTVFDRGDMTQGLIRIETAGMDARNFVRFLSKKR